jgi:hypothetical protein
LLVASALVVILAGTAFAQYDPCNIPPGEYRTYTVGGWRADCHGGNGGCYIDNFFAAVCPAGLTVGGTYTLHFTSGAAVKTYLFDTGTPGVLVASLTDPATSPAGTFGCQVVALALNIGYSDNGIPGFNAGLSSLVIHTGVHTPTGDFFGWTVGQVFALANTVLGGDMTALPAGITLYDLTSVLSSINYNFDGGTHSDGYLVEEACLQGELHVVVTPSPLECVNGEYVPNPFPLVVEVHNTGDGNCTNISVQVTDGAGIGGTAAVQPPNPQTVANLTAGSLTMLTFTALGNLNRNGGQICFTLNVTCDNCPGVADSFCIDVPVCPPPCVADDHILLVPIPPFPSAQDTHACAHLVYGINTMAMIEVPVENETNLPEISITAGCLDCGETDCEPLSAWVLGPWTYVPAPPRYVATLTAAEGATGCCVCVHLDYVLPVELLSFTATAGDAAATLRWTTASETNNSHFEITRDGVTVSRIEAVNSPTGSRYAWEDRGLTNGTTYAYTLVSVDLNGSREQLARTTATPRSNEAIITEYALYQNFPNPFNPTTSITFSLAADGFVTLKLYDVAGQEVATVVSGEMTAGRHAITYDASGLPSGMYLCHMAVNGFSATKKMLLMK